MGEIDDYFFDTYAFYEIIHGNKDYAKYTKARIVTTKLNLMELHYGLLLKYNELIADTHFHAFLKYAVELDDEIIKKANAFRLIHKAKKLSYIDCLGYIVARKMGIKFLTGDKQFKDLDNVEFVP